jgi:hypothetical protein
MEFAYCAKRFQEMD